MMFCMSHKEEYSLEKPEHVGPFTETRERLERLFGDMKNISLLAVPAEDTDRALEFRKHLRREGSVAAEYILERIHTDIEPQWLEQEFCFPHDVNLDFYAYLERLPFCASRRQIREVAQLLASDVVAKNIDRSHKTLLFEILREAGAPGQIDTVVASVKKSLSLPDERYAIEQKTADVEIALETLTTIGRSSQYKTARTKIERAQERVRALGVQHGAGPISQEQIQENIRQRADYIFDSIQRGGMEYESGAEEREDRLLEKKYMLWEHAWVESRLETVRRLRRKIKEAGINDASPDEFLNKESLVYHEAHPSPYAPTLGIEIEIFKEAILPEEKKEGDRKNLHEYFWRKKTEYEKTIPLGVPRDVKENDPAILWEFSNKPVRYFLTLSREVQALIELGLIPKEYKKSPLHVTVGGVTPEESEQCDGKEVYVLARALEATGWSTTGERLLSPVWKAEHRSWNCKGVAGVLGRKRSTDKLEFEDVDCAAELRTQQLQSLAGLDRLLRSAYYLGACLRAHQEIMRHENRNDLDPNWQPDATQKRLAELWRSFSLDCRDVFQTYGLTDPSQYWYKREKKLGWDFSLLAQMLGGLSEKYRNPEKEKQGKELKKEIRKLVIHTRVQARQAMYPL